MAGAICGGQSGYIHIVPAMNTEAGQVAARPGWWMNGGNIAATSDSRLSDLTGESKAAIVRRLIWDEYERLHKPVEAP